MSEELKEIFETMRELEVKLGLPSYRTAIMVIQNRRLKAIEKCLKELAKGHKK